MLPALTRSPAPRTRSSPGWRSAWRGPRSCATAARATLTVGALTVGLALIVALGGLGQHARAAASAWVADVVPGDLVVTSIFPRPLDEGLVETLGDRCPA